MIIEGKRFISLNKAVELFGYSRSTVYRWCKRGAVNYSEIEGVFYIEEDSVRAYIDSKDQAEVAGSTYLASYIAADKYGYSPDYIVRLCRKNKIKGKKNGRIWFVEEASLMEYVRPYQRAA